MIWPRQWMLKVLGHKWCWTVGLIILEVALHQLSKACDWVSGRRFEQWTWGQSPLDDVSFSLLFPNPHEQEQHTGLADGVENKLRVWWGILCWGPTCAYSKTMCLAVCGDILASKQCDCQESSLLEATQPGVVLQRVVWMLAWMFPLLKGDLKSQM